MTHAVIRVTRREYAGSGYAEKFGGGIAIGPDKIRYSLEEALEIKRQLQKDEIGIIVEFVDVDS